MTIACVVPTIRPAQYELFRAAWAELFARHQVELVTVWDGDTPHLDDGTTAVDLLDDDADLIYHRSDVCRNLGFAAIAARMPDVTHILTLDDDVTPYGDTIADHLAALDQRVPISWLSSSPDAYTRGFPYGVREEAPVMVSHGIWYGNADWDAQTQLANGNAPLNTFYRGPVPKGVLFPFCGMNVMIRRAVLPWFYFAPMGPAVTHYDRPLDRFGDIWLGITLKRALDERSWAMVSGAAAVLHTRASDPHVNLEKEALGLVLNERFWDGWGYPADPPPYFRHYTDCSLRYFRWVCAAMEATHAA